MLGCMACDQTQRRDGWYWSQEHQEYKRRASFASAVVCSSGADQVSRATASSSGSEEYHQHWPTAVPMYPQPHRAYYPNNDYRQPFSPEHNTVGSSAYQYRTSAVTSPQIASITSYGYTSPQPYTGQYHHGAAYSTTSYQTNQGYTTVESAHVPLSPSSATAGYQGPPYAYVAPTANVSASPPDSRYRIPPVQSPESPPIDAEYSVPCPYRCGTILTGVHALGNLTRHLKTQACAGSSRTKVRYPCPIDGCERQYARSDGLRVHMRRRHGAPPPVRRTDGVVDDDED